MNKKCSVCDVDIVANLPEGQEETCDPCIAKQNEPIVFYCYDPELVEDMMYGFY